MKPYRPISGRDFRGRYRSSGLVREDAADRRRERSEIGACINGKSHGKATHGCRCERCALVHRYGLTAAKERPEWELCTVVPLDHTSNPSVAASAA